MSDLKEHCRKGKKGLANSFNSFFFWSPSIWSWSLQGDLSTAINKKSLVPRQIQEMRVALDHVHIFLSFPPRNSIAHVVGMLKSISASEIFDEFPEVKKELWGGKFWEDAYFARTVGDK